MRGHRQAFPTPGGPPGGVPPTAYAGGAPATPEGTGKATRRAALRGFRGDKGGVPAATVCGGRPRGPRRRRAPLVVHAHHGATRS